MWLSRGLVDFLRELRLVFVFIGCTRLAGSDYPMDTKFLTLSKTPEGGVIKLCVRTLLIADSEAMSHFCIHIKYASRCYPPPKKNQTLITNQK